MTVRRVPVQPGRFWKAESVLAETANETMPILVLVPTSDETKLFTASRYAGAPFSPSEPDRSRTRTMSNCCRHSRTGKPGLVLALANQRVLVFDVPLAGMTTWLCVGHRGVGDADRAGAQVKHRVEWGRRRHLSDVVRPRPESGELTFPDGVRELPGGALSQRIAVDGILP